MTRRLFAVVVALLVAAGGAVAVVGYARTADRRALAGQQAVHAFVAVKPVPAGTTAGKAVADGLIARKLIARAAVPDDVLTAVEGGYDQLVATSAIQPGELVLRPRFAARGTTQGALLVPEGLLAVSVALDDPSHVGPFVTVGSQVAVFDTFNVLETNAKDVTPAGDHLTDRHEYRRATRLLLPSVEVLAVGAATTAMPVPDPAKKSGSSAVSGAQADATALFTLAVTQKQAELLVHAARTGTLTFALLGPNTGAQPGRGVDDLSLFAVAGSAVAGSAVTSAAVTSAAVTGVAATSAEVTP
jgi:pilus assembly protein CpaB